MQLEQIPAIVKEPAEEVGVSIEPALIDAIENDVKSTKALPLLAYTLHELYSNYAKDKTLSLNDYKALGHEGKSPLESIINQKANEAIVGYRDPAHLHMLKEVFVEHLIKINSDHEYHREVALWEELPPKAYPLLEKLIEARLLVRSSTEDTVVVEIAHESLMTHWSLLADWLEKEREFLLGRSQLNTAYAEWKRLKKPDNALLHGLQLEKALSWREKLHRPEHRAYVEASEAYHNAIEAKQKAIEKKKQLFQWLLMGFFLVFGLVSTWQWQQTKAEEERANKYKTEAEVLIDDNLYKLRDKLIEFGRLDLLHSTQASVGAYYEKIGKEERDPETLRRIMVFYGNSGHIYARSTELGDLNRVKEQYEKALEIAQKLVSLDPTNAGWQRDLSVSYDRLGDFYNTTGNRTKAEEQYEKALEIRKKLVSLDPTNAGWQRDLLVSYERFGDLHSENNQSAKALEMYTKCVDIAEAVLGEYPENYVWQQTIAVSYRKVANIYYMETKNFTKARAYYQKSLKLNVHNSAAFLNLYELQLITQQHIEGAFEKAYIEKYQNTKEAFIDYEMLKLMKAMTQYKTVDLKAWQKRYKGVALSWNFKELEEWVTTLEDERLKTKVKEAIAVFKRHR
jgi:tetratricopeptide (TPR) repeat protein